MDTNVVSEMFRAEPDKEVLAWFNNIPQGVLYVSVLTLGEIRKGIERQSAAHRREKLRVWLEYDMVEWIGNRILPIGAEVADRWGRLLAKVGRSVPTVDSLLAATALHHELRMVTRNVRDFDFPDLEVVNPWVADAK